jgi:hypothetical protein
MLDNTPFKVPMAGTHYRDGEVVSDPNKMALMPLEDETFRAILGFVNFLCLCTKPNIAFAISAVSMPQIAPMQLHMKQLNRLRRYVNGTNPKPMGITYGRASHDNASVIKVFSNSN